LGGGKRSDSRRKKERKIFAQNKARIIATKWTAKEGGQASWTRKLRSNFAQGNGMAMGDKKKKASQKTEC